MKREILRWYFYLLISIMAIVILFSMMTLWNSSNLSSNLSSHPRPAKSYTEAMTLVNTLQSEELQMNTLCRTQLMTHGKKTDRAIILVHGYTNCPQQFHELGKHLYESGYNVLIAPLPYHGLADRMTEAHARLTAEKLSVYADKTVDIAQGLGESVTMMGISAGGVTTAWAAQNRSDIDLAVIISPAFGFKQIPTFWTELVMHVMLFLPDGFEWWNPVLKENEPPPHAYPRYSRHALAEILRLGFAVKSDATHKAPTAKKMVIVFNQNDTTINNEMTEEMATIWQAHHTNLTKYQLEADLKLPHDIIDPGQPAQKINIVYPRLMELMKQAAST